MAGDTFGRLFTVTTFGESHGPAMGCVVDGCPPGLTLTETDIQNDLERRRPGRSRHVTQRQEPDQVKILSGVFEGQHDRHGDRLARRERRSAQRRLLEDQGQLQARPRRLHVSAEVRHSRLSRRRPRVRARNRRCASRRARSRANISREQLRRRDPRLSRRDRPVRARRVDLEHVDDNPFFCADPATARRSSKRSWTSCAQPATRSARASMSSRRGVPVGLGEPVFDKLEADLAHGLMSINAVKGVEFGDGFECVRQTRQRAPRRAHARRLQEELFRRHARRISSGQDILVSIALKPTSSIQVPGATVDKEGRATEIVTTGRHDPCVGLARDADRRGDAGSHADGSLLAASRAERRRALQPCPCCGYSRAPDPRSARRSLRSPSWRRGIMVSGAPNPAEARAYSKVERESQFPVAHKLLNSAPDVSRRARFAMRTAPPARQAVGQGNPGFGKSILRKVSFGPLRTARPGAGR